MAGVIETEGLTKRYGHQVAVDHLNLEVKESEIFGFLGPNGAGKTTTLLMLLGLTEPSQGKARVLGFDPSREPLKVKRQVGYLPENMGFYGEMTAKENLQFIAHLNDIPAKEVKSRVEEALETVGLQDEANKETNAYSRGMRQRLGIAEILIKSPKLVFLDEPTLGLDPDGIHKMLNLIVSMSKNQGISVMLCSHLLHQVQRICNRVGIMNKGNLVAVGTLDDQKRINMGGGEEVANLEEIYMRYFQEA